MFRQCFGFPDVTMYLGSYGDLLAAGGIFALGEVLRANASDTSLPTFNASHLLDELPLVGTRVTTFSRTMF